MSDPYRRSSRDDDDEPPLRFDNGRGRRRGGGPAPITLILSLLVLAGVGGGVFYLYRGGARGSNDAPQPVGAPIRDVRSAAPAQPQAADPAAGLSIYKDDPNASVPPAFVPPPEQPAARQTPPPSAPLSAAAPAAPTATNASEASVPTTPDAQAASARGKAKAAGPTSVDDILTTSNAPATKPAKPAAAKVAAAATTPKPAVAGTGAAVVQIGAFSSQHLADQAWSVAAGVAPGAMAGKGKRVVPMEKDGVTLYRTAITGFASHDAAAALCVKLQAAGKNCFVR